MPREMRLTSQIALEIGMKIIEGADNLRLFMPDSQAVIEFNLNGKDYRAVVHITGDTKDD